MRLEYARLLAAIGFGLSVAPYIGYFGLILWVVASYFMAKALGRDEVFRYPTYTAALYFLSGAWYLLYITALKAHNGLAALAAMIAYLLCVVGYGLGLYVSLRVHGEAGGSKWLPRAGVLCATGAVAALAVPSPYFFLGGVLLYSIGVLVAVLGYAEVSEGERGG